MSGGPHPAPAAPEAPTSTPRAPLPAPRPAHHRAGLALLVAAGGAVGSLGRYGLAQALPPQHGWPLGTLTANLTGAFLLGVLLEVLGRRGPETPGVQRVRLALGTGVLGGYTTFSSLALETERLLAAGEAGTALGYAGVSLVAGVLCAAGGVALVSAAGGRGGRGARGGAPGGAPGPGGAR
ncbi:CrcB family protein [Cellulomonas sp.]|uniref:fluoride efflux transporter FluC n=1 Tax=Cellulomonas sp. TaxID=40001 RepID=UPI002D3377A5|nr:CrcB family protein [Cellulomonas sp.]HYQ75516.1 CrcB family protein [Cellulomonas sp.]